MQDKKFVKIVKDGGIRDRKALNGSSHNDRLAWIKLWVFVRKSNRLLNVKFCTRKSQKLPSRPYGPILRSWKLMSVEKFQFLVSFFHSASDFNLGQVIEIVPSIGKARCAMFVGSISRSLPTTRRFIELSISDSTPYLLCCRRRHKWYPCVWLNDFLLLYRRTMSFSKASSVNFTFVPSI